MKALHLLVSLFVVAILSPGATSQTESDVAKDETICGSKSSKIMILGTYHMDNPRLDTVNLDADDVLSTRRQAEIDL